MTSPENPTPEQGSGQPRDQRHRASLVAAIGVVIVIVLLGVGLIVWEVADGRRSAGAAATPAATSAPPASQTSAAGTPSSDPRHGCGLRSDPSSMPSAAPEATWKYEGTTAYPTSAEYGPSKTAPEGYHYCFARSATGALFAAANTLAVDDNWASAWADYMVGDGPFRDKLLSDDGSGAGLDPATVRFRLAGYRLLDFSLGRARVDLAVQASTEQGTVLTSMVEELVWQDGDWHYAADIGEPISTARIPDLTGYTAWGEG